MKLEAPKLSDLEIRKSDEIVTDSTATLQDLAAVREKILEKGLHAEIKPEDFLKAISAAIVSREMKWVAVDQRTKHGAAKKTTKRKPRMTKKAKAEAEAAALLLSLQ